jgi:ABC-type bacteriocin/lantibiotic exporter with double-glycine peptidase domain
VGETDHGNHSHGDSHAHPTPYQRLGRLIQLDRSDHVVIVIYTILIGLLTLAVPLAAQALVNTIAAGVLIQPLVVLTIGVLAALFFAGILRLFKLVILEKLQQRIFARVSLHLSDHLPRVAYDVIVREFSPQLVNRFFDVLTIQKTMAKILFDGPGAALQVVIALVLMSFYSPYLLAFALFLMIFVIFVIFGLGVGGLRTSIQESTRKYEVADWLEELARCHVSFKMNAATNFSLFKADRLISLYVEARRAHFRVLFRQAMGIYFFQAIASAGVLAIGGWLVINRQLTLGQVVASEIVVVGALEGLEKLVRLMENVYDLLTGLYKVGHLTDMPAERTKGWELPASREGVRVDCRKVRFSYSEGSEILSDLDLSIQPGEHVSLVGKSGVGKSTLAMMMCGLHEPTHGLVQINGMDIRDVTPVSLRRSVSLVSDMNEIFAGTMEENILMGRQDISHEDLQWALELSHLTEEIARMPRGLQSRVVTEGRNLSRGQQQRLLIARAVISRPKLLILDEGFTGVDENDKLSILNELFNPRYRWTILDISHDPEIVARTQRIHVLAKGHIVESGSVEELIAKPDGELRQLFPTLSNGLR